MNIIALKSEHTVNLNLKHKIGQMGQLDIGLFMNPDHSVNWEMVREWFHLYKIGSILDSPYSGGPEPNGKIGWNATEWRYVINEFQKIALETTGIPIIYGIDSIHGATYVRGATLLPTQLNLAATFNPLLAYNSGLITSKDTRAAGMQWLFSPVLGLALHPAWPRFMETFGEDPYLASVMGQAIIKGIQYDENNNNKNNDNNYNYNNNFPTKAAACMKHFIGYSNPNTGHDRSPVVLNDRLIRELYIPSFKAAIDAGVMTAMESYQEIGGIPMIKSKEYLKELLRKELKFDGVLVSDYQEIENLYIWHHAVSSHADAIETSLLETSIDMSMIPMDHIFYDELYNLVGDQKIDESRLDTSVHRILQLKEDLGILDNPFMSLNDPLIDTVGQAIDSDESLKMSQESIVLLQNNHNILPLQYYPNDNNKNSDNNNKSNDNKPKIKVYLSGPTANNLPSQIGGWAVHWQGPTPDEVPQLRAEGMPPTKTVYDAFKEILVDENNESDLIYETYAYYKHENTQMNLQDIDNKNVEDYRKRWTSKDRTSFLVTSPDLSKETKSFVDQSDVIVLCLGESFASAEKPGDIDDLSLDPDQLAYAIKMDELAITLNKPMIIVLITGRPRLLNGLPQLKSVTKGGIIYAGLPGPLGGQAIADVIFGQINPSGKLPFTWPQEPAAIPYVYHRKPSDLCTDPKHPNYYVNCPVEWWFGEGLSYSTFEYSNFNVKVVENIETHKNEIENYSIPYEVDVSVTVSNIGVIDGKHTVLLFIYDIYRPVTPEYKLLKRFDKIFLKSGESKIVNFKLTSNDFMYVSEDLSNQYSDGEIRMSVGPYADCRNDQYQEDKRCSSFTLPHIQTGMTIFTEDGSNDNEVVDTANPNNNIEKNLDENTNEDVNIVNSYTPDNQPYDADTTSIVSNENQIGDSSGNTDSSTDDYTSISTPPQSTTSKTTVTSTTDESDCECDECDNLMYDILYFICGIILGGLIFWAYNSYEHTRRYEYLVQELSNEPNTRTSLI